MSFSLIKTKLFVPHTRATLVPRVSLQEKLHNNRHKKATFVLAPAGFSKSTLVSDWLEHSSYNYCWFSIDEEDNDANRFFGHFLSALIGVGACSEALLSLLSNDQPPNVEHLMSQLINELALLEATTICVLDDFHSIDNELIQRAVQFLLDHHPKALHLVFISREDPPFSLSKYRAKDEIVEIRAQDLSFSQHESTEFFNQVMGLGLSDDDVAILNDKIEGWPVGLHLAALPLKNTRDKQGFLNSLSGSHRYVLDYLVEEVLNNLTPKQQDFLLNSCVLKRFNRDLCCAMLDQSDAGQTLDELEKNSVFIISLDNQGCWYRYHHLFADVLATRVDRSSQAFQDRMRRASQWFDEHGHPIEAIEHALLGNDADGVLTLLDRHWPTLRLSYSEQFFIKWLEQLDATEDVLYQYPTVMLHYGFSQLSFDLEKGRAIMDRVNDTIQSPTSNFFVHNQEEFDRIPGIISIAYAYHSAAIGQHEQTVIHATNAAQFFDDHDTFWVASSYALLSIAYANSGRLEEAKSVIEDCIDALKNDDTGVVISFFTLLIGTDLMLGNLSLAHKSCQRALTLATKRFNNAVLPGMADVHVYMGDIAYERGDLIAAQQHIDTAVGLGVFAQLQEQRHHKHILMAKLAAAQKDYDRVEACLLDFAQEKSVTPVSDTFSVEAFKASLDLQQGKLDDVSKWVSDLDFSALNCSEHERLQQDSSELLDDDRSVAACFFIARYVQQNDKQDLDQAHAILSALLTKYEQQPRKKNQCSALITMSVVHRLQDDPKQAQQTLNDGLVLAQENDYVRLVLGLAEMLPMLTSMLREHFSSWAFVQPLLSEITEHDNATCDKSNTNTGSNLQEPLSDREISVLNMLASDLSGPQIAETLFISINTLRTHTKNIYIKLDVNSRRTAIARAKALNII